MPRQTLRSVHGVSAFWGGTAARKTADGPVSGAESDPKPNSVAFLSTLKELSYVDNTSQAARTVITSKTSDAAAKRANLTMTLLMSAWTRLCAIRRAT